MLRIISYILKQKEEEILCQHKLWKTCVITISYTRYLFYYNIKQYHKKYLLPMDKVYMRNETSSNELNISFRYCNMDLDIDRTFNFCRKMDENIEDCLLRMRGSIEKELQKKFRKSKKKKTNGNLTEQQNAKLLDDNSIYFLSCHKKLENVTFSDIMANRENLLQLKILDDILEITINQPWVTDFNLPSTMMAGFMVYPCKLQMQFAEKSYCHVKWFKAKIPVTGNVQKVTKWQHLSNGFFLNVSNDEVGYFLKAMLIPGNDLGNFGPAIERISKNEVQPGPGPCPFEIRHLYTQNHLQGSSYRIISYNILANLYADSEYSRSQLFPYCPPYALDIEYRKCLLLKEIIGYNGDIICLQEVDMKVFDMDLGTVLQDKDNGYKGVYAQKGCSGEGLAIFYNVNRLNLVEHHNVNISEYVQTFPIFQTIWEKIKNNAKLVERISNRATALQLALIKAKTLDRYLLVVNTHLYFHPDADHIRLLQMGFAMLYIEDMYQNICKQYNLLNENLAIVFCGDFNSVPECGIYQLMTKNYVNENIPDWRSNPEEAVTGVTLRQPFNMKSACGTPPYTNYTHLFAACLDYIFYQEDRLEVEQIVPLPSKEELTTHIAIPSVVFPSDHIALVADLKFKD